MEYFGFCGMAAVAPRRVALAETHSSVMQKTRQDLQRCSGIRSPALLSRPRAAGSTRSPSSAPRGRRWRDGAVLLKDCSGAHRVGWRRWPRANGARRICGREIDAGAVRPPRGSVSSRRITRMNGSLGTFLRSVRPEQRRGRHQYIRSNSIQPTRMTMHPSTFLEGLPE